jgi:hypothetical protein
MSSDPALNAMPEPMAPSSWGPTTTVRLAASRAARIFDRGNGAGSDTRCRSGTFDVSCGVARKRGAYLICRSAVENCDSGSSGIDSGLIASAHAKIRAELQVVVRTALLATAAGSETRSRTTLSASACADLLRAAGCGHDVERRGVQTLDRRS